MSVTNANSSKDIVAEAISRRRTVRVGVDAAGYIVQVQFGPDVRTWDVGRIGDAIVKVAAVAHDRYAAVTDESGASWQTTEQIAAAERALDF